MEKGLERIEKIVAGFDAAIANLEADPQARQSEIWYHRVLRNCYHDVLQHRRENQPGVHSGLFAPRELYRAMGIAPYAPEFDALLMSMMNQEEALRIMDRGESTGVTKEICSPHRIGLGMVSLGLVPQPSFVVSSSAPCDVTNMTYEIYSRRLDCPAYLLDTPYGYGEKQMSYLKKDIEGLIDFLEEQTRQKLDHGRLQEAIELSSQGYAYWEKINALRKNVPNPIRSRESTRDFAVTLLGAGTPEAIRFFQARYEELQELVRRGEGAVPQERHRITWLYALPYFDLSIADYLAERHGASIVVDLFSYASAEVDMSDTSDPIAFLARKTYKGGLVKGAYGSYDHPAARDDFLKMCSEYGSDAVILLAHWGCKQYCGLSRLLKDDIQAEVGLPLLTLDADIIDPRIVSSPRVKARLDEFFATLG